MNEQLLIKHHKEVAAYLVEFGECKKRINFLENLFLNAPRVIIESKYTEHEESPF